MVDVVSLAWETDGRRAWAYTLLGKLELVRRLNPNDKGLSATLGWGITLKGVLIGWAVDPKDAKHAATMHMTALFNKRGVAK